MAMNTHGIVTRPFRKPDAQAWDTFVRQHPQGTVFHRPAWSQAVRSAYKHRPVHLTAWRGGDLVGICPLFLVDSVFVGRALVSIPYATYGGILADDAAARRELLTAAQELAGDVGAAYVDLRHRDVNELDLPAVDRYDTFRKELPGRAEDVLPSFPKKARAAARSGLECLTVQVGDHLLGAVYHLYARTMRRLGSPNFRRRLFDAIQQSYGPESACLVVFHDGRPVAGVMSLVFRNEIVPYFSGSTAQGRALGASNVMYLKLMEYAIERGLRWFDFNRTRRDNAGPHSFKRHLGFEPTPLHYQIWMNGPAEAPNLTPSNRAFALAGRVWRHLPLWVTRPAGAAITKWIP